VATLGSRLTRRPEWPLVLVFTWFPLWWVLGLTQLAFLAATVWMAWWLLRRTSVTLPHGLGWWLLFLVTVGVGVVAVKVDVPGAMHLADDTRYLTWALRMVWLVEATVVLLYIRNTKEQISSLRVSRILATMFVTIVVGGLLGSLLRRSSSTRWPSWCSPGGWRRRPSSRPWCTPTSRSARSTSTRSTSGRARRSPMPTTGA